MEYLPPPDMSPPPPFYMGDTLIAFQDGFLVNYSDWSSAIATLYSLSTILRLWCFSECQLDESSWAHSLKQTQRGESLFFQTAGRSDSKPRFTELKGTLKSLIVQLPCIETEYIIHLNLPHRCVSRLWKMVGISSISLFISPHPPQLLPHFYTEHVQVLLKYTYIIQFQKQKLGLDGSLFEKVPLSCKHCSFVELFTEENQN